MRIGDSKSESYKRLHARRARRKQLAIERLCYRLDRLVERAESFRKGRTRMALLKSADGVSQKLRKLDH